MSGRMERLAPGPTARPLPQAITGCLGDVAISGFCVREGSPRLHYRGFASDPVSARFAIREIERASAAAFGFAEPPATEIRLLQQVPERMPLPGIRLADEDPPWPHELRLIGDPLPRLVSPGMPRRSVSRARSKGAEIRRIRNLLLGWASLTQRKAHGRPLLYAQSVVFRPHEETSVAEVRFGVWTETGEVVPVPDALAQTVLIMLMRTVPVHRRSDASETILPRPISALSELC